VSQSSSIQNPLRVSSSETSHPPPARFSRTGHVHPRLRASRLAGGEVPVPAPILRILNRMAHPAEIRNLSTSVTAVRSRGRIEDAQACS
jgi:hypothetical protein